MKSKLAPPNTFPDIYKTEEGRRLWSLLHEHDNIIRLETSARLRRPGIEAIMPELSSSVAEALNRHRFRQAVGAWIKHVFTEHGYAISARNILLRDCSPFTRGCRYAREKSNKTAHV